MDVGVSVWDALRRTRTTRWSFWKFNWLANHKILGALERTRAHAHGQLVDIGCGSKVYAPSFAGRVERYWGIDLPDSRYLGSGGPDAYARAEALPFREAAMDTALCLSVVTYFQEPGRLLAEAHRVLKPGGILLIEFTQMAPLHDAPHDYFRFTRFGARYLLERAGFEPLEFVPIGGLWARVGLSLIAGLNRLNRGPRRIVTEIPVRLLYMILQLFFEFLDRLFLDPHEVLSHLVVARKRNVPASRPGG